MRKLETTRPWIVSAAAAVALLGSAPAPLAAQLANPSAAAAGLGENFTARVRGYGSMAWNPAGLAMPDTPGASFALLPVNVLAGLGPIGMSELAEVEGQIVSEQVKTQWFEKIAAAGGEEGSAGTDVTYLALQIGRFGVQASSIARMAAVLGPEAAELLLFGNAGRTGEAGDFALAGSSFELLVVSSAGISYAHPIVRGPEGALSIGATLKQSIGHLLVSGRDSGSQLESDPLAIRVDFPIVHTDTMQDASALDGGRGISLDLGAAWQRGPVRAGLVIRNLVDTFAWDEEKLICRPGIATAETDDTENTTFDIDARPFSTAPAAVQARLDEMGFAPVLAFGIGYDAHPQLLLSVDAHRRLGDSVLVGSETHVGAGAEILPVNWLPLRVGAALVTGGHVLSGGAGLRLGPIRLSASAAQTSSELGKGSRAMFTLSAGGF